MFLSSPSWFGFGFDLVWFDLCSMMSLICDTHPLCFCAFVGFGLCSRDVLKWLQIVMWDTEVATNIREVVEEETMELVE